MWLERGLWQRRRDLRRYLPAQAAGATLAYSGRCTGECRVCAELECLGEPILDERGCPTCTCTCRDGECPAGLDCVAGACVAKDAGPSDAMTDAPAVDAAAPDAAVTDASGCEVDIECAPGRCEGAVCVYDCESPLALDCDDDGSCETMLGRLESCRLRRRLPRRRPAEDRAGMRARPRMRVPLRHGLRGGSEDCTDSSTDRLNCGACGRTCEVNEICDGTCSLCADETTVCGNLCVHLDSDPLNCGICGMACEGGETCLNPNCVDSACLDPAADAWSCTGGLGDCQCTCDTLTIDVGVGGIVTCRGDLMAGLGCTFAGVLSCEGYEDDVVGCCLP